MMKHLPLMLLVWITTETLFGDVGFQMVSCDAPTGYVSDDTDCNDLDAAITLYH